MGKWSPNFLLGSLEPLIGLPWSPPLGLVSCPPFALIMALGPLCKAGWGWGPCC